MEVAGNDLRSLSLLTDVFAMSHSESSSYRFSSSFCW